MLYWYPLIKNLDIPQPVTKFVNLSHEEFAMTMDGMPKSLTERVDKAIKKDFKLPVFIRTCQASGKHYWKDTCFYDGSQPLSKHLFNICEANHCADIFGLRFGAIVIREYIPMESLFTAFYGNLPISPERRYFIKDKKILCRHHYWIDKAIQEPSVKNWKKLNARMNEQTDEEIKLLTKYCELVAAIFKGFWSVDFCRAADGRWILIDMAEGEKSWHPEGCPKLKGLI